MKVGHWYEVQIDNEDPFVAQVDELEEGVIFWKQTSPEGWIDATSLDQVESLSLREVDEPEPPYAPNDYDMLIAPSTGLYRIRIGGLWHELNWYGGDGVYICDDKEIEGYLKKGDFIPVEQQAFLEAWPRGPHTKKKWLS